MPPKRKSTTGKRQHSLTEASLATTPSSTNKLLNPTNHTLFTLPASTVLVHATNCLGEWGAGIAKAIAEIWPLANDVYTAHCQDAEKGRLEGTCLLIPPQREERDKSPKVWIACLFTSYGYGRPTKKKAGKDSKAKIVENTGKALRDLRGQLEILEKQEQEWVGPKSKSDDEIGKGRDGVDCGDEDGEEGDVMSRGRKRKRSSEGRDGDGAEDRDEDAERGESTVTKSRDQAAGDGDVAGIRKKEGSPSMTIYSPKFNSGSFGVSWDQTGAAILDVFRDWNGEWFVLSPP